MFITNVTENKFSKSPDEQGLVCGHWGTSHPLTPLSGHYWSERTACSKYTNTNTQTQTHSLLATSDGLYLIRACSLARASTSRGGEVCIRFVLALVKRISVAFFFSCQMCLFPFLRDWKTYLQNSTCLSKALSQNFRPQKSHAWGGQKINKRTKLTQTHLVIVFCLCRPPFLFCHFAAFWHLALLHLRVLDEQFSELIFFYQTSTSDFHSLLTASKIFLGLLFAFSQIWNVKVKKWSRDEKRRRDDLVNCVRREGGRWRYSDRRPNVATFR